MAVGLLLIKTPVVMKTNFLNKGYRKLNPVIKHKRETTGVEMITILTLLTLAGSLMPHGRNFLFNSQPTANRSVAKIMNVPIFILSFCHVVSSAGTSFSTG